MPADDNGATSVFRFYTALESASQEMLKAARAGDWDSVCRLEGACSVVVSRLRDLSAAQPLKPQEREDRMRILRNIIANDAEIRRICEPLPYMLDARAFHVGAVSNALH